MKQSAHSKAASNSGDEGPTGSDASQVPRVFRSLRHRNFRIYCAGQVISLCGTWMQNLALSWLVFKMTHSAWMLGVVSFSGLLPTLVFGLAGGSLADRMNRRKVCIATQALALAQAAILSALTLSGHLQIWHIIALSFFLGVINAFDIPARQALLVSMVEREDLVNAVSLHSSIFNGSRAVGPALASLLVAQAGEGACFCVNALSYFGALVALSSLRLPKEKPRKPEELGRLANAISFCFKTPQIRNVLILTAAMTMFGAQFLMLMPVFASNVLQGSIGCLGWLTSGAGAGAFCGAFFLAHRGSGEILRKGLGFSLLGFSVALEAFCFSRSLPLSVALAFILGFFMVVQLSGGNSFIQLKVPDALRGRVMSIYMMVFMGMGPIGNLALGWAANRYSAPSALSISALGCAAAALVYLRQLAVEHRDNEA